MGAGGRLVPLGARRTSSISASSPMGVTPQAPQYRTPSWRMATAREHRRARVVFGVVRDIANNNSQDPRAGKFCEIVKRALRSHCFYGLGSILGTQNADADGKREACSKFARDRDLAACVDGATT